MYLKLHESMKTFGLEKLKDHFLTYESLFQGPIVITNVFIAYLITR